MLDHLPKLGASIHVERLPEHLNWLLDGQRDLELPDIFSPGILYGDPRAFARKARSSLEGYSGLISIHGPFLGFTIDAGDDPGLRAAVTGALLRALDFAGELGATQMVVHSPFWSFGANPFCADGKADEADAIIDQSARTLEPVIRAARGIGCMLVVENICDADPAPLLKLVRSFDAEDLGLSLDVGHAHIASRRGGATPDQRVRQAGPLLAHLHLHDNDGNADRHWTPGDGNLGWFALFEALAESEAEPRLLLEVHDPSRLGLGAARLGRGGLALAE
jgi:sugar phosphate isomerase/epimerase